MEKLMFNKSYKKFHINDKPEADYFQLSFKPLYYLNYTYDDTKQCEVPSFYTV